MRFKTVRTRATFRLSIGAVAVWSGLACGPGDATGPAPGGGVPSTPPERPFLLVVNKAANSLSAVDPGSLQEVARVQTGFGPHEVAVSVDGDRAFVTNYGGGATPGRSITVVDLTTMRVAGTIGLGQDTWPHGIVAAPDRSLWVTTEGSAHLLRIDPATGEIVTRIPTGQPGTHMVALAEQIERVVTANIAGGSATVANTATGLVVAQIETGAGAEGVDVHPDGRRAYVSNRAANTLVEVDLATNEVVRTLAVGSFPIRVRVRPDGREALVSNAMGNEVVAVDLDEWRVVRRLQVGALPIGILITPDNGTAYVANTADDSVVVVDLTSWTISGQFAAGPEPDGMDWVP